MCLHRLTQDQASHGDLLVPRNYTTSDGFRLGVWVNHQRMARKGRRAGHLGSEQIQALDSLGFIWDCQKYQWSEDFKHLNQYRAEHGDVNVPQAYTTSDGFKFGFWVGSQRRATKGWRHERISPAQIQQLDSLGFVWEIRKRHRMEARTIS